MREVAREAGVSMATVSRVLTGARPVGPEVAQAVLEASQRLGYQTNVVARSLRTQRTGTVGMVVPHISNPYFPAIVEAVERELNLDHRQLFLCDSQDQVSTESDRVTALLARKVDGLLLIACEREGSSSIVERASALVPVVLLDRLVGEGRGDFVGSDNTLGVRLVMEHLRAQGARTFAFVGAEPVTSPASERLEAFRDGTQEKERKAVLLDDFSYQWGQRAGELLTADTLPDAVICAADLIALGLLSYLTGAGIRVPDDVLVTGFDDIGFASLANPPLTSVRQPTEDIGIEAVRMLRARLAHNGSPGQHRTLQPTLVTRGSTAH